MSKRKNKKSLMKKIILSFFVFVAVFLSVTFLKVKAGESENGRGWLWGGSDDGAGNNTGVGWISVNNVRPDGIVGGGVSYGLNIPSSGGDLSGYAWSENIGWIDFNSANLSGCPSGTCAATRTGNTISGWARIKGIADEAIVGNSGGWQGWIKLSGTGYEVTVGTDNKLMGYAWSDELGWIDFSRVTVDIQDTLKICTACDEYGSEVSSATLIVNQDGKYKACKVAQGGTDCSGPDRTLTAIWKSDEGTIATVSAGTVTANSKGETTITATEGELSAEMPLTVIAAPSTNCGDGVKDSDEECDEGSDNGDCPKKCSTICKVQKCINQGNWREVAP